MDDRISSCTPKQTAALKKSSLISTGSPVASKAAARGERGQVLKNQRSTQENLLF